MQGADGVAFIADSQLSEAGNNAAAFLDLRANMKDLGIALRDTPLVIQFNKQDLPNVRSERDIELLAQKGREPVFRAAALNGKGVLESFFGLLALTWSRLEAEHQLARTIGIPEADFLPLAARQLGYEGDVQTLLGARIGGSLDYTRREDVVAAKPEEGS